MLYDSTKTLLQSILGSLEVADESRWDDLSESGKACLYEMHQMCGAKYRAYKNDSSNANSAAQGTFPEKLNRAMPHARLMVVAIRHRDRTKALDSGKTALAEMNGIDHLKVPVRSREPGVETKEVENVVRQHEKHVRKHRPVVEDRSTSRRYRVANAN